MKRIRYILCVLAVGMALAPAAIAQAAATPCQASMGTSGDGKDAFVTNNDGTLSATINIQGDEATCKLPVSMAVWQAPNATDGQPVSQQKLFVYTTGIFAPGTQTLTLKLPGCYYQAYVLNGSSPTDANGSAVYNGAQQLGTIHGGSKSCTAAAPAPATPAPAKPTAPSTPKPASPAPATTQPPASQTLPHTGTGANVFMAAAFVGLAATLWRYRQLLNRG